MQCEMKDTNAAQLNIMDIMNIRVHCTLHNVNTECSNIIMYIHIHYAFNMVAIQPKGDFHKQLAENKNTDHFPNSVFIDFIHMKT